VVPLLAAKKVNRGTVLWVYALIGLILNLTISLAPISWITFKSLCANFFILAEFLCFCIFYRKQLEVNVKLGRALFSILTIIYLLLFFQSGYKHFNATGASVFYLSYISFALAGFVYIMKRAVIKRLETSPFFIANAAILIYTSSVFFVFLTYFIFRDDMLRSHLWHIVVEPMNAFKYLLFALALRLKDN
jgi:hypothetical protein